MVSTGNYTGVIGYTDSELDIVITLDEYLLLQSEVLRFQISGGSFSPIEAEPLTFLSAIRVTRASEARSLL